MTATQGTPINRLRRWARKLKSEVYALYLAYRDPRVPWYARALAAVIVGYAFSPIDLIPDPIPVLGYLDDVVLIPLGIALTIRLIPDEVLAECREKAKTMQDRPVNRVAAAIVVAIWVLLVIAAFMLVRRYF